MTGGLLALHDNPDQWAKLRANPALVDSLVPEIVRWQTPLAYMRRTALQDIELGGKRIQAGDKVAMWYLSGNRDEQRDRATPTTSSSTARGRASTCRSASASTAASATGWPSCSCASCGKRS